MFSKGELEEIDTTKELCNDMQVNGFRLICFNILSDLAHNRKSFSELSSKDLSILEKQLFEYKELWEDVLWFDNRMFLDLLPRLHNQIKYEQLKFEE